FVEKDSRTHMGGLPRWDYILHLFANGFHFASIAVFLAVKLIFTENGIEIVPNLSSSANFELFQFLAVNLLPGAFVLAIIHVLTSIHSTKTYWNKYRAKISCC